LPGRGLISYVGGPYEVGLAGKRSLALAATASRGLFAQQLPSSPETMQLRGVELRYVLPDPMFDNSQADPIKALYVNAWAFGSASWPSS